MRSNSLTLAARYLFPVEGPPIADGCLTIEGGRIAWFGPSTDRRADLDLGNVAVTPGFINTHTHLELSALEGSSTSEIVVEDEIAWLRRVIDQRRNGPEGSLDAAVGRNLVEAVQAGTTTL
ncbi:amidohydrolase family protein, partial [Singulisphaera rosea]